MMVNGKELGTSFKRLELPSARPRIRSGNSNSNRLGGTLSDRTRRISGMPFGSSMGNQDLAIHSNYRRGQSAPVARVRERDSGVS